MDRIVNNIWLTWKLIRMLKTYKTCNSTVGFSKYEFYNKLLDDITLLRVTSGVTWTQPYIYISYIYIYTKIMRGGEFEYECFCHCFKNLIGLVGSTGNLTLNWSDKNWWFNYKNHKFNK